MNAAWTAEETERFWAQILRSVARDNVIPIVGQELLQCEIGGRKVLLQHWLAEQLQSHYRLGHIAWRPYTELSQAVGLVVQHEGITELPLIYDQLWDWCQSASIEPPASLQQLASITPISLFISTTFDGLMGLALNRARSAKGAATCESWSFSLNTPTRQLARAGNQDITRPSSEWERRSKAAAVYNLFGMGSFDRNERFAIHDEDVLEYVHLFTSMEELLPEWLRNDLRKKTVLMLGCHFSDWLTRFLIRRGTDKRLLQTDMGKCVIAADGAASNIDLVEFLRRFSPGIQVYPDTAAGFIEELLRRWEARPPAPVIAIVPGPAGVEDKKVTVFISYVREDNDAVELIKHQIIDAGGTPWIDVNDIQTGQRWRSEFVEAIESKVDLFLAVVSKNTEAQARNGSEVYREWKRAQLRAETFPGRRRFVFPVVIDTENPDEFASYENASDALGKDIQFGLAPRGAFADKLKADLNSAIRSLRGAGR